MASEARIWSATCSITAAFSSLFTHFLQESATKKPARRRARRTDDALTGSTCTGLTQLLPVVLGVRCLGSGYRGGALHDVACAKRVHPHARTHGGGERDGAQVAALGG